MYYCINNMAKELAVAITQQDRMHALMQRKAAAVDAVE